MFTKLYIANDHGGYTAKIKLLRRLDEIGVSYEDLGSHSEETVRYPYYAARAVAKVLADAGSGAVLICSTGIGMSIIANKFKGIRAALCTDGYMARATRMHNDSNVLCLGGRVSGDLAIQEIVDNWLAGEYQGGRHAISLGLIAQAEDDMLGPASCGLMHVQPEDEK